MLLLYLLNLFKYIIIVVLMRPNQLFFIRYPCQGTPWGYLNIYDRKGQFLMIIVTFSLYDLEVYFCSPLHHP
jgi:hypothetical protein